MTWKDPTGKDPYEYYEGFNNHITASHLPGIIPSRGNNPQVHPYGLYTEQLSGTAFTVDRAHNQRTWLYRVRPSVEHLPFKRVEQKYLVSNFIGDGEMLEPTPTQLRWDPFEVEGKEGEGDGCDFVEGIRTIAGAGEPSTKMGIAIHWYGFNRDMSERRRCFYNSDGDMLILPQRGVLDVVTEFGKLCVPPGEICVVPRGVKFSVDRYRAPGYEEGGSGEEGKDAGARGYILETYSSLHFTLPDLGPIGANGLANPKDFRYPVPFYPPPKSTANPPPSTPNETYTILNKFIGRLYSADQPHTPFDVIAYQGNYLPYKYPLSQFSPVGSISFDHPDPSIFTVLTLPNPASPGTALADFVVFPPRWLVAEGTFRPPYFHRNVMSEFMVNVMGAYDAKAAGGGGFNPGGASLHNMNTAHGPDRATYEKEVARGKGEGEGGDKPVKIGEGNLAVMFETSCQLVTTRWAVGECGKVQGSYGKCWEGFEDEWEGKRPDRA